MEKRQRGRPKTHVEAVRKTTVLLPIKLIGFLDHVSAEIMEKYGVILDRGALIRSILWAIKLSELNLSESSTENEMVEFVKSRLK